MWIVDDDVLPGNKFLEELSHIAGVSLFVASFSGGRVFFSSYCIACLLFRP